MLRHEPTPSTYTTIENGKQIVVAWLIVPDGIMDKADVDRLVDAFRDGPGRNASKARCSKCPVEGKHLWDPKPASLKRHLHYHFHIPSFECSFIGCDQQFVTKDQAVVHVMKRHMIEEDRNRAATYVFSLFPN
ncbi:hypothetical protein ACGC1H_001070 [Rhizoctonia solani]